MDELHLQIAVLEALIDPVNGTAFLTRSEIRDRVVAAHGPLDDAHSIPAVAMVNQLVGTDALMRASDNKVYMTVQGRDLLTRLRREARRDLVANQAAGVLDAAAHGACSPAQIQLGL